MLVLTRRIGQRIIIGPSTVPVEIQLIATKGSFARLGIVAPKETVVDREEVAVRRADSKKRKVS